MFLKNIQLQIWAASTMTSILAGLDVRTNILETTKDKIIKFIKFAIHGKHMHI